MVDGLQLLLAERAITRLIHEYSAAMDEGRFDDFAQLFSRGTWRTRHGACTGSRDVRDQVGKTVRLYDGAPGTRHNIVNIVLDVQPSLTSATGRCSVLLTQSLPDGPGPRLLAQATYTDTFARADDAWYFVERAVRIDGFADLDRHIVSPDAADSPPGT